jgi:hypothetical protein
MVSDRIILYHGLEDPDGLIPNGTELVLWWGVARRKEVRTRAPRQQHTFFPSSITAAPRSRDSSIDNG